MDRGAILELGLVGLVVSVVLIAVRAVWLMAMGFWRHLLRKTESAFGAGETLVLAWSGMRGVISLAAALALPVSLPSGEPLPAREAGIVVTFPVILVTLGGQGLTLPLVIRAARLAADDTVEHEAGHARRDLVDEALKRIGELYEAWPGHRELLDQLRTSYQHRAEHEDQLHEAPGSAAEQELVEHRQIRRAVIDAPGVTLRRFAALPGRESLVVRLEGSDPKAPSLLLMGHTDVVPVNPDGWTHDPFAAELADGIVWGRGAVDMLTFTASMAVALKRLLAVGFRPKGTLVYAAVADEEAAGVYGAEWLGARHTGAVKNHHGSSAVGGARLPFGRGGARPPPLGRGGGGGGGPPSPGAGPPPPPPAPPPRTTPPPSGGDAPP